MKNKDYKLVSKAWKCTHKDWDDYDNHYTDTVLAENRSKAIYVFMNDNYLCKEEYIQIRCVRCKEDDVYEYNGIKGSLNDIKIELNRVDRKKKIDNFPDDAEYYIQDSRSYNGNMIVWWANEGNGYTSYIDRAWKVTGSYIKQRSWRDTELFWRADHVEENISRHVDSQRLNRHEFMV